MPLDKFGNYSCICDNLSFIKLLFPTWSLGQRQIPRESKTIFFFNFKYGMSFLALSLVSLPCSDQSLHISFLTGNLTFIKLISRSKITFIKQDDPLTTRFQPTFKQFNKLPVILLKAKYFQLCFWVVSRSCYYFFLLPGIFLFSPSHSVFQLHLTSFSFFIVLLHFLLLLGL